jgi:hypothetical protein
MKHDGSTAADLRRRSLERYSQYWKLLKSNVDCFVCLQRMPEHLMECGHGLCDVCVSIRAFSAPTKGREYYYNIKNCPQCQAATYFQARVLPPTCRVRFLAIDGGGSRGVVSLGFMEELRRALDLKCPVQEHFDYSIGTSSGMVKPCFGIALTDNRWYCRYWALWQKLEPSGMSRILSQICKSYISPQKIHRIFYMCFVPAYL